METKTGNWIPSRRAVLGCLASLACPSIVRASTAEKLVARVDFSPWGLHAAKHLATVKGWYKEAGLEVDVQDGRGSSNTLQLVNAGQADVGQVSLGLLPQARANGATVKSIAGWERKNDLAVLVDKDSSIKAVEDFAGKTVVVFAASLWAPFIDLWLSRGGLDRSKVNIMFVDPSALWSTYTSGRVDGIMTTPPSVMPAADAIRPSKAIHASEVGLVVPSFGMVASESSLRSRSDALKGFTRVQVRAWNYIREGNLVEAVSAIVQQRPDAKLDAEILKKQLQLALEYFDTPATVGKPIGWQAEEDWLAALDTMRAAGVIRANVSPADFYTNDFLPT